MTSYSVIKYAKNNPKGAEIIRNQKLVDDAILALCYYLIQKDIQVYPEYSDIWRQKINELYSINLLPKQTKMSVIQLDKDNMKEFLSKYRNQLVETYRKLEIIPCIMVKEDERWRKGRHRCYIDRELNRYVIREKNTSQITKKKKKVSFKKMASRVIPLVRMQQSIKRDVCRCECCQAITKTGQKCKNKALYDGYCWVHKDKLLKMNSESEKRSISN